jgi:hypothetical protein
MHGEYRGIGGRFCIGVNSLTRRRDFEVRELGIDIIEELDASAY